MGEYSETFIRRTWDPTELVGAIRAGHTGLDGAMSPQTTSLLVRFGTTSLYMVELWALTPPAWTCPGCGRGKPEIVRLNVHGELMCILVEHHDHMEQALEQHFVEHSTAGGTVVADELCKRFVSRSGPMLAAYDRTVMCQDCNNADASAKKLVGAPRFLSFSPAEIRRFVVPSPNEEHALNEKAVQNVFDEIYPTFLTRMRFVNGIARIAAGNRHWFQPSDEKSRVSAVRHVAKSKLKSFDYAGGVDVLCGTRRSGNHSYSAWRTKRQPKARRFPKPAEIEHVARVDSPKRWDALADDWHCPVCDRSKVQVIRTTNGSAQFTFLAEHRVFLTPPGMPGRHRVAICGDCWIVGTEVGREACNIIGASRSQYMQCVFLAELRTLVVPQPHGRHNVRPDAAQAVLDAIVARLSDSTNQPDMYS